MFINTITQIIIEIAKIEKLDVILSGGVFQNKILLELTTKNLKKEKITYFCQHKRSVNDSSIALGQAFYFLSHNLEEPFIKDCK